MNCQFCNKKEAEYRCSSCGTSVCSKHTENNIGTKIFYSAIMFLFLGVIVAEFIASLTNELNGWELLIAAAIAFGISDTLVGKSCMKCKEKLKAL
jgi:hypothetical protein